MRRFILLFGMISFLSFSHGLWALDCKEVSDMKKEKVSEETILALLERDAAKLPMTPDNILLLKESGASDYLLNRLVFGFNSDEGKISVKEVIALQKAGVSEELIHRMVSRHIRRPESAAISTKRFLLQNNMERVLYYAMDENQSKLFLSNEDGRGLSALGSLDSALVNTRSEKIKVQWIGVMENLEVNSALDEKLKIRVTEERVKNDARVNVSVLKDEQNVSSGFLAKIQIEPKTASELLSDEKVKFDLDPFTPGRWRLKDDPEHEFIYMMNQYAWPNYTWRTRYMDYYIPLDARNIFSMPSQYDHYQDYYRYHPEYYRYRYGNTYDIRYHDSTASRYPYYYPEKSGK